MPTLDGHTPTPPPVPDLVLDMGEAAHLLRCGKSTVRRLVADGRLDTLKIGRRRLITTESLRRFVLENLDGR